MTKWYYLDPDNRKDPSGLHCARCKKLAKDHMTIGFTSIALHPENPWFRLPPADEAIPKELTALIGNDCLKKMIKQGEMTE